LEYSSESNAKNGGVIPSYGEYSFRLYAQEAGPHVTWIPEVTDLGMSIYNQMVATYNPKTC